MSDGFLDHLTKLKLSVINQTISTILALRIISFCIFVAALFVFLVPIMLRGEMNLPPEVGDATDYDAIGLQLSKGMGFSFNWDDTDYKEPYLRHNQDQRYNDILARYGGGLTAYRPSLLPVLVAASHQVFGRQFWPIRFLNSIFAALTCSLAFFLLSREFGAIPGAFCAISMINDKRLQFFANAILTEASSTLLVTAICLFLFGVVKTRSHKAAILLGATTGIAFLARSTFFLWVPFILFAVYVLAKPRAVSWFDRASLQLPSLFLASFMLVAAPWMLRNCFVLGEIEPLGTMGSVNLSAGYSDEAFNRRGIWFSLCEKGFFEPLTEAISEIEREKAAIACAEILPEKLMANYSRGEAIQWIYKNPLKVPMLMYFKVRSLWSNSLDKSVLLFSGLGFLSFMFVRPREAFSILFILGACTSAVGITWDVGDGRFLVPVEAPLFMLYALGLWSFIIASSELAVPRLAAR